MRFCASSMRVLALTALLACSSYATLPETPQVQPAGSSARNPTAPAPSKSADPQPCSDSTHVAGNAGCRSAAAFDAARVPVFELTITKADRTRMLELAADEATENTYVPAQLAMDGEDVGMVGVRYKGSHTLRTCIGDDLTLTCDKVSYKVKFDEYDDDKRWHGLKKVNLHAMYGDGTLMHEHLGYGLFRAMGVVAPRATHAQVSINGTAPGVFALVEAPDGRFTADRFAPGGDGNLYKEIWPVTTAADEYQLALETNKDVAQDHAPFVAFARELQTASRARLAEVVGSRIDPKYMLRYMAVDRILSNWDGVTTFYCGGPGDEGCGNHNMYWYVDEPGERFWLVPWDLDNTWVLHTQHESAMPAWNDAQGDCSKRVMVDGNWMLPPGCDPLFQGLADLGRTGYHDALVELLAGPFNVAALHAEIDRLAKLLLPAVKEDPALDVQAWQTQVEGFKNDVALLRQKAELLRDNGDVNPTRLRTSAINNFEATVNVTLAMGTKLDPNPGTVASRSLNRSGPLRGRADLRTDFVFRTGKEPWTWLNLWIGVQSPPADLSRVRRLRLALKADKERTVRLEIDSSGYSDRYSGVRFGWDVTATTTPTTITLELAGLTPSNNNTLEDDVGTVMSQVEALLLQVNAHGLNSDGFFPVGDSDEGFLQIDDVEFLTE